VATVASNIDKKILAQRKRASFAYKILVLFTALYYLRPEDVIPGLGNVPIAKIIGGLALVALVAGLASGKIKTKLAPEMKILLLLFAHLCLTIPFAYWRGGAFKVVFEEFGKGVIVALLVSLLIETFPELRKLLWVQAGAMAIVTVLSLAVHRTDNGRLVGALGGVFENPNDLAINISMNWPLCVAFLLLARGALKKLLWMVGVFAMLYAVQSTYSRSGFLALAVGVALVLLEFGIRGRRVALIAAAVFAVFLVVAIPSHYRSRLLTIVTLKEDRDANGRLMSGGSVNARENLLREGITTTLHHPLFGVGPGNFQVVAGQWHVVHNTYLELGSEGGIPAMLLFLLLLGRVYKNLTFAKKSPAYKDDKEFRILTGGLYASFGAYLVGAFFSDTAYELFPYFMLAYTSAFYRLALASKKNAEGVKTPTVDRSKGTLNERTKPAELVWNR